MNGTRRNRDIEVDHPLFGKPSDPLLRSGERPPAEGGARLDWRQAVGVGLIILGFISLVIGYVGISGTTQTYDQLTYFLSNGLGGAAAIILGSTVLIIREHIADRDAMRRIDLRLAQIDMRLPADAHAADNRDEHARSGQNGAGPTAASRQHA